MANISVSLPADGTTADVSDYNTPINTIVIEINGKLDNSNIAAAAAIAGSKLADDSVTAAKIDASSITRFSATTSASINATTSTITSYTEVFDIGSNFASGVFTAPANGDYQFNVNLALNNQNSTRLEAYLQVNGSTVRRAFARTTASVDDPAVNISVLLRLTSGNTVRVQGFNEVGSATLVDSSFDGYLVALN